MRLSRRHAPSRSGTFTTGWLPRPARAIAFAAAPLVVALLAGLLAACGDDPASGDDRVRAATTVAPITSIVSAVGGDRVAVEGIVPEGADSHTFEPPPSVARVVAEADVLFLNGLGLEEPTRDVAEANIGDEARIVRLGDEVLPPDQHIYDFSFPEEGGLPNPHAWTHPPLAVRYAEVVRDVLAELDPDGAATYDANLEAFTERAEQLDAAMREATRTVPPEHRVLLTYHDSWAYFARDHDWEVIGAIQPSDLSEPSPREIAALIDQIRERGVPAIFGSEVFPSQVLRQIGAETGARYVDVLRDDDLPGDPGDDEHSWLGMMRFDFVTMVEAMGGDAAALEAVPVAPTAPDEAVYPQ
ncbi:MAG: metal ABC transporter substrate-binding protein [Acidimicrobiia bacterium]